MKNKYGYAVKIVRTDAKNDPILETPYAKRRRAEDILTRRRVSRNELAKMIGVCDRQASRILNELSLIMPIAPDDNHRWGICS